MYHYSALQTSKELEYSAIRQQVLVDLVENTDISNLSTYLRFTKQLKGVFSGNEALFEIVLQGIELPEMVLDSINAEEGRYYYDFESLKYNLLLRINSHGDIIFVENEHEVKLKWGQLRTKIAEDLPRSDFAKNLLKQGDSLFVDGLFFEIDVKRDSFLLMLFPPIYGREIKNEDLIGERMVKTLALLSGEVDIPVEVWYVNLEEDRHRFRLDNLYHVADEQHIVEKYNSSKGKDFHLLSYVYQHYNAYTLDKNDSIENVEGQHIENINGDLDIIEYIKITLLSELHKYK